MNDAASAKSCANTSANETSPTAVGVATSHATRLSSKAVCAAAQAFCTKAWRLTLRTPASGGVCSLTMPARRATHATTSAHAAALASSAGPNPSVCSTASPAIITSSSSAGLTVTHAYASGPLARSSSERSRPWNTNPGAASTAHVSHGHGLNHASAASGSAASSSRPA